MLNKIEAYTSRQSVHTVELEETPFPWRDLFHIKNVDGLDPVTASISTTGLPAADLSLISGEEVPARNIVMTLVPDPDWEGGLQPEVLRRYLYEYFTPKYQVRLVFYTDTRNPVEIYGEVEACSYNQFTPEPEYQISIICPDPYFTDIFASTWSGSVITPDVFYFAEVVRVYGDVPIGFQLKMEDGYEYGDLFIQTVDPAFSAFRLSVPIGDPNPIPNVFEMDSRPLKKKVRTYQTGTGVVTNLLKNLQPGYEGVWPVLQPGYNQLAVMSEIVEGAWMATWYEKYSGL